MDIGGAELLDVDLFHELNAQGYSVDIMSVYSKEHAYHEKTVRSSIPNIFFLGMKPSFSKYFFIWYSLKLAFLIYYKGYSVMLTSLTQTNFLGATARLFSSCSHIIGVHYVFNNKYNNSIYERLMPLLFSEKKTFFYAVSEYAKDAWVEHAKISENRVNVVYNYIDKDKVLTNLSKNSQTLVNDIKINSSTKIVVNIGRICSQKNQLLVVDALKHDLIDKNIVILFIGLVDYDVQGTKAMYQKIEQTIKNLNLNNHVRFLGYQSNIESIIRNCDLLVHTTNREAFGLVLLETMILGIPIISTNVEAIPEILKGTKYVLIPPNDVDRLREVILKHFEISLEERRKIILSGKAKAKEFTKKGKRVGEIMSIIKKT